MITEKQTTVLSYLTTYWREHCYGPTIREIGRDCNLARTGVHQIIARLQRKGAVVHDASKHRSYRPTPRRLVSIGRSVSIGPGWFSDAPMERNTRHDVAMLAAALGSKQWPPEV